MEPRKYKIHGGGAERFHSYVSELEKKPEDKSWSVIDRRILPTITDILDSPHGVLRVDYQTQNGSLYNAELKIYKSDERVLGHAVYFLEKIAQSLITEILPQLDTSLTTGARI